MNVLVDGGRLSVPWRAPRVRVSEADGWGRLALVVVVMAWTAGIVIGFENSLMVLTVCGFVAAVWGLRRPQLGLLGVSLLCTLDTMTRSLMTGEWLRWNTLNYWLVAVCLLYCGFIKRSPGAQAVLAKAFLVLLALQLLPSPDISLGIQHILGLVAFFGLLIYFVRATRDERIWPWLGLVNGSAGAIGGLLFILQMDRLPPLNHNVWAFFPLTAIFAICVAYPFVAARASWAVGLGVLAAVNLCWVFLSASRGDLLIGIVCMLFLFWTTRGVVNRLWYVAVVAVVSLSALAGFPELHDRAMFRITKLLDAEESAESRTSGRSDLVKGGVHIFSEHPLGVGTGGFARSWAGLGYVEGVSGFKYGETMAAHAGWIKVLVENGVVGIVMLAMFVASFAVTGLRQRDRISLPLGILVTAVFTQALTSTEFQPKGLWLLAAGTATLLNLSRLRLAWSPGTRVMRRAVPGAV